MMNKMYNIAYNKQRDGAYAYAMAHWQRDIQVVCIDESQAAKPTPYIYREGNF